MEEGWRQRTRQKAVSVVRGRDDTVTKGRKRGHSWPRERGVEGVRMVPGCGGEVAGSGVW